MSDSRYIVVEGPIGVGKTTLARRLAERLKGRLLLEKAEENPFLEDFYRHRGRNAFQTQLFFLVSRYQQQRSFDFDQADLFEPHVVGDYLFDKNAIFARLTLSADEYQLFLRVLEALGSGIRYPGLVVYLWAPVEVLLERIRNRGIRMERHITAAYIESLLNAYNEYLHTYTHSPVLIVNTAGLNLVDNEAHFEELYQKIITTGSGVNYFDLRPGDGEG